MCHFVLNTFNKSTRCNPHVPGKPQRFQLQNNKYFTPANDKSGEGSWQSEMSTNMLSMEKDDRES